MLYKDKGLNYRKYSKRKRVIRIVVSIFLFLAALSVFIFFSGRPGKVRVTQKEIVEAWKGQNWTSVFELSDAALKEKPMDFFFLMTHGLSAYQVAQMQVNNEDMLSYLDRSIWALRRALLTPKGEKDARIKYVLGKDYYYKGPYYADLCIKYLKEARDEGSKAEDIPQFLGLAYASLKDYTDSIISFSEALKSPDGENSDILLLAIARSYIEQGEKDRAMPYLVRVGEVSKDWLTIRTAKLLYAGILIEKGDYETAQTELSDLLKEGGENAEVCFELGELYNAQNDHIRARAEWRRAAKLDPNFAPARARLSA